MTPSIPLSPCAACHVPTIFEPDFPLHDTPNKAAVNKITAMNNVNRVLIAFTSFVKKITNRVVGNSLFSNRQIQKAIYAESLIIIFLFPPSLTDI